MPRAANRDPLATRPVRFERNCNIHAEGSALIHFGNTIVLCTASAEKRLPHFLRNSKQGWLTAEYSMLPRATSQRNDREASRGKQSGRTLEIQRLIGRSLRRAVDLKKIPEITITIDCDVIQADGGTRTAAITGGCLALYDALNTIDRIEAMQHRVAAISVGLVQHQVLVDLDYTEDSTAMTDLNLVMDDQGGIIEIQGTAEESSLSRAQLHHMLDAGSNAIDTLLEAQAQALHS